ncbi:UDP-glucose--hexose-1-phosphate uridylyltransferase, partial [Leuconostoc pseudomesenteroides]|nr:UDP-glucose--hexose-1-phosphate uridylyltransferase [Leuconostoc pseudomesenteroides]
MAEIDLFTAFAKKIIEESDYTIDDEIYLVNQIMGLVGETNHNTAPRLVDDDSVTTLALLDQLTAVAEKNGTLALRQMNTDMLGAQLMNFIVPRPSQVRKMFWEHYQQSPRQATDYFFDLSQRSNYIKTREISQNISYPVDTQYGTLQITIN